MQNWMEISTIFPIICKQFNIVAMFEMSICYTITCILYICTMFTYLQIVRQLYISALSFLFLFLVVREITPTIKKRKQKYNFKIKLRKAKTSIGITIIRHVNWDFTKLCVTFCPLGNISSLIGPMLLSCGLTFSASSSPLTTRCVVFALKSYFAWRTNFDEKLHRKHRCFEIIE